MVFFFFFILRLNPYLPENFTKIAIYANSHGLSRMNSVDILIKFHSDIAGYSEKGTTFADNYGKQRRNTGFQFSAVDGQMPRQSRL